MIRITGTRKISWLGSWIRRINISSILSVVIHASQACENSGLSPTRHLGLTSSDRVYSWVKSLLCRVYNLILPWVQNEAYWHLILDNVRRMSSYENFHGRRGIEPQLHTRLSQAGHVQPEAIYLASPFIP